MKRRDMWNKYYECDCGAEGIMLSTEDWSQDKQRQVYLAFFTNTCKFTDGRLSWHQQLRWIWQIIVNKMPFADNVLLDTKTAHRLGKDLIKFSKGKLAPHIPMPEYLKKVKKVKKIIETPIEGLYHPEKVL